MKSSLILTCAVGFCSYHVMLYFAGSMSVSFHLVSPLSKDLFRRAISESGVSPMGLYAAQDPQKGLAQAKKIAKGAGEYSCRPGPNVQ